MTFTKTKWITTTSLMIALLLLLQTATKPLGQFVTGSCVNAVLSVTALAVGLSSGLTVAVLSPFFAFLLGIGPQFFPLTPAIALGNCVLVFILYLICKKACSIPFKALSCLAASFAKFATLNLVIVQIMCRFLPLPEKQITMFSTMFSWPQLITALIGTSIALIIVPRIKATMK